MNPTDLNRRPLVQLLSIRRFGGVAGCSPFQSAGVEDPTPTPPFGSGDAPRRQRRLQRRRWVTRERRPPRLTPPEGCRRPGRRTRQRRSTPRRSNSRRPGRWRLPRRLPYEYRCGHERRSRTDDRENTSPCDGSNCLAGRKQEGIPLRLGGEGLGVPVVRDTDRRIQSPEDPTRSVRARWHARVDTSCTSAGGVSTFVFVRSRGIGGPRTPKPTTAHRDDSIPYWSVVRSKPIQCHKHNRAVYPAASLIATNNGEGR